MPGLILTVRELQRGFGDFSDFADFGLGDIFDMFFGGGMGGGQRRQGPKRGADLRYDLTITLHEAAFGAKKEIEVPITEELQEIVMAVVLLPELILFLYSMWR